MVNWTFSDNKARLADANRILVAMPKVYGAGRMTKVYSAASLMEAYLVRDMLGHSGIEARVLNENLLSIAGEIPLHHARPEVWILHPDDRQRALAVAREMDSPVAAQPGVFCPGCHEENPKNFELCWHCGRGLQ